MKKNRKSFLFLTSIFMILALTVKTSVDAVKIELNLPLKKKTFIIDVKKEDPLMILSQQFNLDPSIRFIYNNQVLTPLFTFSFFGIDEEQDQIYKIYGIDETIIKRINNNKLRSPLTPPPLEHYNLSSPSEIIKARLNKLKSNTSPKIETDISPAIPQVCCQDNPRSEYIISMIENPIIPSSSAPLDSQPQNSIIIRVNNALCELLPHRAENIPQRRWPTELFGIPIINKQDLITVVNHLIKNKILVNIPEKMINKTYNTLKTRCETILIMLNLIQVNSHVIKKSDIINVPFHFNP